MISSDSDEKGSDEDDVGMGVELTAQENEYLEAERLGHQQEEIQLDDRLNELIQDRADLTHDINNLLIQDDLMPLTQDAEDEYMQFWRELCYWEDEVNRKKIRLSALSDEYQRLLGENAELHYNIRGRQTAKVVSEGYEVAERLDQIAYQIKDLKADQCRVNLVLHYIKQVDMYEVLKLIVECHPIDLEIAELQVWSNEANGLLAFEEDSGEESDGEVPSRGISNHSVVEFNDVERGLLLETPRALLKSLGVLSKKQYSRYELFEEKESIVSVITSKKCCMIL